MDYTAAFIGDISSNLMSNLECKEIYLKDFKLFQTIDSMKKQISYLTALLT